MTVVMTTLTAALLHHDFIMKSDSIKKSCIICKNEINITPILLQYN